MKKYFLLFCISALVFTGCDQDKLDIPQKGVVAEDEYYITDEHAEAALAAMYIDSHKNFSKSDPEYNFGPLFGLTNFQSPDMYLAGSGTGDCVSQREFQQFRYTNTNALPIAAYTMFYRSIHKANIVINKFAEGTSNTMKRAVAEARVMRAYDHMMLGIYWGTPPIVTEVLAGSARPENAESQEAVMDWVASEIDLALPDLTERQGQSDKAGAVKITQGFAYAIKGKALLWKGDYTGAKTALKEVITSDNYALVPSADMVKIGHADGKASIESVFEFNVTPDPNVMTADGIQRRAGWNDHMTFNWRFENFNGSIAPEDTKINANGWGWLNPTGDYARALIDNDGMDSPRREAWIKTYDEVLYDHLWASDFIEIKDATGKVISKENLNLTLEQKQVDPKRGVGGNAGFIYGNEGYFCWKIVVHKDQGDLNEINGGWNRNLPLMRYAEVLLMYAEACAQSGTDEEGLGLSSLQLIQDRAGVKVENRSVAPLKLADVQKEKRFELWLEGGYSSDLIRWGKDNAAILAPLKNQGKYVAHLRDGLKEGTHTIHTVVIDESEKTDYYDTFGEANIGFKEGKHELLPFPLEVINLNTALEQNPGWE